MSIKKIIKRISFFLYNNRIILLSFFIPVFILTFTLALQRVYPFGGRSVLIIDLYHQYAPFLLELRNKMMTFSSFYYTWSGGLGSNFIPLYAYYLASPLNLLLILFPPNHITEAILVLILIKVGLSGVCFTIYLMGVHKEQKLSMVAFSIMYALSGYVLAYFWNVMWMDGVYLFPLVVLGLVKLVRDGKGSLFCISLTVLIFSNFYMAFFICLFLLLYYPICLLQYHSLKKPWILLKKTGQFALFALLAAGMTAVLLLPTWIALRSTSATGDIFPKILSHSFDLFDYISRHLVLAPPTIREGLPNLYGSMALLIFLPVYFFSRSIRHREKLTHGFLLLFLLISFNTNMLDFIWHGFHFPNQLPYRNSIVYIFLVLTMAYPAFQKLEEFTRKQIGTVCVTVMFLILLIQKLHTPSPDIWMIYVNIILVMVYGAVLTLDRIRLSEARIFSFCLAFLLVVVGELTVNTILTVTTIDNTEYYASRSGYSSGTQVEEIRDQITAIQQEDTSFYRMELMPPKTTNDPFLYGYKGLSVFSSTFPEQTVQGMKRLGYHNNGINSYKYEGSTILLDALFGIRYLIRRSDDVEDRLRTPISVLEEITVYKSPYALSLGFLAPEKMKTWKNSSSNPLSVQDDLIQKLTGIDNVLLPLKQQQGKNKNLVYEGSGTKFYRYKRTNPDKESTAVVQVLVEEEQQVYLYLDTAPSQINHGFVMIGDKKVDFNAQRSTLVDIGYCHPDIPIEVHLVIKASDDASGKFELQASGLQQMEFEKAISIMKEASLILDQFNDTQITGQITALSQGLMIMTIPYDKGWKVTVDGKSVETFAFYESFLSFVLSPGHHTIELKYVPEKLYVGLGISVASLLIFLCTLLLPKFTHFTYRKSEVSSGHLTV